jgi:hypothetical protein
MRLRTRVACLALLLALTATSAAQQTPGAASCPERDAFFDLPIDEYIAQADKERTKRNKNPLPERFCLGGWCPVGGDSKRPKPTKEEEEAADAAKVEHETRTAPIGQSSSKETRAEVATPKPGELSADKTCDLEAVKRDLAQVIKDVEVGDFYFSEKKFRPALSRYEDASTLKPNDPAIQLRLARTLGKLDRRDDALAHYRAVAGSGWQGPGVDEAKAAVARLTPAPANTP